MEKVVSMDSSGSATVTVLSWERLFQYWQDENNQLDWNCIFMLPPWLKTWWDAFGEGLTLRIYAVWHRDNIIGIAPLIIEGTSARLMGDSDLVDHVDFIIVAGKEIVFFNVLFQSLKKEGITLLDTGQVRIDSPGLSGLKVVAGSSGFQTDCQPSARIYEIELPRSWEEFLSSLSKKERHEVRRKLRRLHASGPVAYRVLDKKEDLRKGMETFLSLFKRTTAEKVSFLTPDREAFFLSLADALAEYGLLKLAFLEVGGIPISSTLCFDYNATMYIYNNGYDIQYRRFSAGLLSKVLSIENSIDLGRKKYDFLKGDETYKMRLGGAPVQLSRCWVKL